MKTASCTTNTTNNENLLLSTSVVRVKLTLYRVDTGEVSNVWMSLDYSQRPTVWHVVENIRAMYLNDYVKSEEPPVINLYMDEYWIPPYEKSRILRENDCITVEICPAEYQNDNSSYSVKKTTSTSSIAKKASESKKLANYTDYYYSNYDMLDYNAQSSESYWEELKRTSTECAKSLLPEYSSLPVGNEKQKKLSPPVSMGKSNSKSQLKPKSSTNSGTFGCHKKFSIGAYAHLLNDSAVPPTTEASKKTNKPVHESELDSNAVDKMAASLVTQGKAKWKNSSKPAATTDSMPKHIRFDSSSEDDSTSSSSSSSSSSESEEEIETKPTKIEKPEIKPATSSASKQNKYYEPSKEDQLNAVSNNRSFLIQNTKDLNEFKKTFNQAKLNAPKTEAKTETESKKKMTESESMSSLNGSNVSSNEAKSPRRRRRNNNNNSSPKSSPKRHGKKPIVTDYSKYDNLNGTPRENDKIAFQILELSKNFTPEISDYKTGTVKEFDSANNQVTIKLDSQFKSVLERSSKFSVVLDDEEDNNKENDNMSTEESETSNEITVDLNNLINIKLL